MLDNVLVVIQNTGRNTIYIFGRIQEKNPHKMSSQEKTPQEKTPQKSPVEKMRAFYKVEGFLHKPENRVRGFLHKPQNRVKGFLHRRLLMGFLLRAHFVRVFFCLPFGSGNFNYVGASLCTSKS